mmetsp:Transcript_24123/g.35714  ORF Transcript_24123/g.35714 Transcript_24123/m.35714 type:complete len:84 (+) Transcript_24123:529-780(+)
MQSAQAAVAKYCGQAQTGCQGMMDEYKKKNKARYLSGRKKVECFDDILNFKPHFIHNDKTGQAGVDSGITHLKNGGYAQSTVN